MAGQLRDFAHALLHALRNLLPIIIVVVGFQALLLREWPEGGLGIMLLTLEKGLSLKVLKAIREILNPSGEDSKGLVMTLPVEHLGGIDMAQVKRFEERLRHDG